MRLLWWRSRKAKRKAAAPTARKRDDDDSPRFGWRQARGAVYVAAVLSAVGAGAWAWREYQPYERLLEQATRSHARHVRTLEIAFASPVVSVEGVEEHLLREAYALASPPGPSSVAQASGLYTGGTPVPPAAEPWGGPFDAGTLKAIHSAIADSGWVLPQSVRVTRNLERGSVVRGQGSGVRDQEESIEASSRQGIEPQAASSPTPDPRPPTPAHIDRITIEAEFRRPFALIRRGDLDYLVDASGTRLPVHYTAGRIDDRIPVILNTIGPIPHVGDIWPGRDVTDGLALIRFLRKQDRPWFTQIRAVDVSNWDGRDRRRVRLEIVTDRGYRIAWGRAVGEEAGVDIPAAQKVQVLDDWWRSHGHVLGSPQGPLLVNNPLIMTQRRVTTGP